MPRDHFTFFESFFQSLRRIRDERERALAYDAIAAYALYEIEPDLDELPDIVAVAFINAKPNLDASKRKAESGKAGGQSPKAGGKQTPSKSHRGRREKEKDLEKEMEMEPDSEMEGEYQGEADMGEAETGEASRDWEALLDWADDAPQQKKEEVLCFLPLKESGKDYAVTESMAQNWAQSYPGVDVPQELLQMRSWLQANPTRRKTRKQMPRFITGWLSREQDKAPPAVPQEEGHFRTFTTEDLEACFDDLSKWEG